MMSNVFKEGVFYIMKNKSDKMEYDGDGEDDIDAKMYTAFSCVDCDQKFESREELEEHESRQH
jgi:hypothetical protein